LVYGFNKPDYHRSNDFKIRKYLNEPRAAGQNPVEGESNKIMIPGKTGESKLQVSTHIISHQQSDNHEPAIRAMPTEGCKKDKIMDILHNSREKEYGTVNGTLFDKAKRSGSLQAPITRSDGRKMMKTNFKFGDQKNGGFGKT